MIWYSSSIPIVREGGCMQGSGSASRDEERGDARATTRRHIDKRLRGKTCQHAIHVAPIKHERRRVEDAVLDAYLAVQNDRVGLRWQRDALLDDPGLLQ